MKEWQIENLQEINLVEGDTISREEGEVKLKISKVAISATDFAPYLNDDARTKVIGHSAIGYVSEADESSGLKLGSRVVISPFIKVREHGVDLIKTMGVDVDGLLRDFVSVKEDNVFQLPDGISDEEAIFCEQIAIGNKVFGSFDCNKGDYIVIVGASTLGLMLSQLALYYQMVPILVDLDGDKLDLAEQWGVCYTLNPTFDNLERRVEQITGGRMCEAAIFAGEAVGINSAIRLVKNEGDVIIAGYTFYAKHQIDTSNILRKQLRLKGVCNGMGEMSSAINLLANKIIKTNGLISAQANFEDVPEVLENCVNYPYQYNKIIVNID